MGGREGERAPRAGKPKDHPARDHRFTFTNQESEKFSKKSALCRETGLPKGVRVREHRFTVHTHGGGRGSGGGGGANQCNEAKTKVPVSDIGLRPALAWVAH